MSSVAPVNSELPTLHHLNNSVSQRILWLLEELSIEYNLKLYSRDPVTLRAPPSLATVSPLGKSPVLVTSDKGTLTESSAIAAYLLSTFDSKDLFERTNWLRDEMLTSFAGTTMGPLLLIEILTDIAESKAWWPISLPVRWVRQAIHKNISGPELRKGLVWLELELGSEEWFGGKKLSRADIMIIWPLDLISQKGWIDIRKDFPKLAAWRERVMERSAWKRAIAKGNGYDLAKW
ncbi:BgTH12-07548 [Blumeria graminis f. sp. triticale]|uniref:BgTH12-07548 n=1 Tax=Blumeria graminis f. sp. triticale TaxID=1689686 RepID=A0A9W4CXM0_BLUGR|nr:BgTH12-07548 [Blumeria graminis f. sp. triticale]